MTFPTSPRNAQPDDLADAAHKLSFSVEFKKLDHELRQRGYRLLNQALRDPSMTLAAGKLAGYAECYKLFTGKDLFDAGT